jgi:Flp pilus assembly protein CpaB
VRVSRRARALAFLLAAALAAAAAAAIADSYGNSVARGYGALRPVVVATADLPARKPIGPELAAGLEVRRVPVRFLPPGALRAPAEAVGLVPVASVAAGTYLLASQLRPPMQHASGPVLGRGRRAVGIAVGGIAALLASGPPPPGTKVDVVVTTEPSGAGPGRTYVAAAGVPLLSLQAGEGAEAGEAGIATLGLTRPEALRLIAAQSFARQVTILPPG